MKKILFIIMGVANLTCFGQKKDAFKVEKNKIQDYYFLIDSDTVKLENIKMNGNTFEKPEYFKDTIKIYCVSYLEELNIIVLPIKINSFDMTTIYQTSQHLTDDDINYNLDFFIEIKKNRRKIEEKNFKIYDEIDFTFMEKQFLIKYGNQIFDESYYFQKLYFSDLLKQINYPNEYKVQAKNFLKLKKSSLKTFKKSNIEIVVSEIKLNISNKVVIFKYK